VTPDELRALIRSAGETGGDPSRFGKRHPLKTDDCPPRTLYDRAQTEWTDAQRAHAEGCRYCQRMLALATGGETAFWAAANREASMQGKAEASPPSGSSVSSQIRSPSWWALGMLATAATALLVLTGTVLFQTRSTSRPDVEQLTLLSQQLTSAPSIPLQETGARGSEEDAAPVVRVAFSPTDTFVRIVVPVPQGLTALEFALRRDVTVVWRAQAPVADVAGKGSATAIIPTSLLSQGAAFHLAYRLPGAANWVEWRLVPELNQRSTSPPR
jgi:hypothetical protein